MAAEGVYCVMCKGGMKKICCFTSTLHLFMNKYAGCVPKVQQEIEYFSEKMIEQSPHELFKCCS